MVPHNLQVLGNIALRIRFVPMDNSFFDSEDIRPYTFDADKPYCIGMVLHDHSSRTRPDVPPEFIGYANFGWQHGKYVCLGVGIQETYQRRGFATAIYDVAEAIAGETLSPSKTMSPDAKAFWISRRKTPE